MGHTTTVPVPADVLVGAVAETLPVLAKREAKGGNIERPLRACVGVVRRVAGSCWTEGVESLLRLVTWPATATEVMEAGTRAGLKPQHTRRILAAAEELGRVTFDGERWRLTEGEAG